MTDKEIYIKGCLYAIFSLMENGSFAFVERSTYKAVEWNKIIDWLLEQIEED